MADDKNGKITAGELRSRVLDAVSRGKNMAASDLKVSYLKTPEMVAVDHAVSVVFTNIRESINAEWTAIAREMLDRAKIQED